MSEIKLSAVIITYNEEKNIARCLDSLQGVADEIIVIDSHSTDKTESIARAYGVIFIEKDWDNFSLAKNFGVSKATYDYILSLDADEALSQELKNALLEEKKDNKFQAYYLKRLTQYCGKWIRHCGWYPDYKIRLWDRNLGKWQGTVHETLQFNKAIAVGKLHGDLLHYSFNSIKEHIDKANRFSEISAKEVVQEGKKVTIIYHLVLNPLFTFVSKYIFRLGFLDGYYGFIICVISAFSNFLKYSKIRALSKANHHY